MPDAAKILLTEGDAPATPAAGIAAAYAKTDHKIYTKGSDGVEHSVTGDMATDVIWDAKGDLAVGTGVNTAAKLTVGADGKVLVAASGEATGLKWDTAGVGDVTKAMWAAQSILAATLDDDPAAVTMAEQTVLGRLTGGNIDDVAIGIADNNMVQIDQDGVADDDYARFTAAGLEGRSYAEVRGDLDLEAGTDFPSLTTFNDHSARHLVGADDTIFPADPGADKYLMWDDDPGALVWADAAGGGSVATDAIWDAAGDLAVGSGANTAAKLAVGAEDTILMVQSGTPAWVAPAAPSELAGVQAAAEGSANTFARSDHAHQIQHAITDNHLLTVDGTLEDNDFAYATANGIEGKTAAESLTLLLANPLTENDAIKLDAALSADGKYNGITQTGVAGATLAFGDVIYQAVADDRWELAKADAAATCSGRLGICILAAASNGDATNVLLWGTVRADTAFPEFTKYAPVFISSGTAGDLVTTVPSKSTNHCVRCVGQAITADELEFHPSPDWLVYA